MGLIAQAGAGDVGAAGLRDMELRAGVFDGDALLAERVALLEELAPLDAIVGPGGVGEQQLKSLRYALAAEARQRFAEEGRKVTEGAIEEAAQADPRYVAKLAEHAEMRASWVTIRAKVDQLTARLQWAMALLRYAANEPRG